MAKQSGKKAPGGKRAANTGEYDAREELTALMCSELSPELTERAAALLERTTKANNLTPEQQRRISIQFYLSENLGIFDKVAGAIYPDDDAANLTLLSIRRHQAKHTTTPAETAREFLRGVEAISNEKVILSRALFSAPNTGGLAAILRDEENKAILDQGNALMGAKIGLAGGGKMMHAVKLLLGEYLSKESDYFHTTATLGGIPPDICKAYYNIEPPKVAGKNGEMISAPTIIIPISRSVRIAQGKSEGENISGRDIALFQNALNAYQNKYYFRMIEPGRAIATPAIIAKFPIVERQNEGAAGTRNYLYYLLCLSPDFAVEAADTKEGEKPRPKDYVSIQSGTAAQLSGNSIQNAIEDYAIAHQGATRTKKVAKETFKAYLLEQCPDYKGRKARLNADFADAVKAINGGGSRGYSLKLTGDYIVFQYAKKGSK